MRSSGLILAFMLTTALVEPDASGQEHSIFAQGICAVPIAVGAPLDCRLVVSYNDSFGDSWLILEAWAILNPGPNERRVPVRGDLSLIEVIGNTTAVVGGTTPFVIGAEGSVLSGLPGEPDSGEVTFGLDDAVDHLDPAPLPIELHVRYHDLCDSPGSIGCTTLVLEAVVNTEVETFLDCQGNGIPDDEDIIGGAADLDGNGVPDECQDCNMNGAFDPDEIAADPDLDLDLDGVPDECQAPFGGFSLWTAAGGGLFRATDNWDPAAPGPEAQATFDLDAAYAVTFDRDAGTRRAIVRAGDVNFDLGGFTCALTATFQPGLVVAELAGEQAALTVNDGSITAEALEIGTSAGAVGTLVVSGPAGHLDVDQTSCIGCAGFGSLVVADGALAAMRDAAIGSSVGSLGDVLVTGAGTLWDTSFFVVVSRGVLEVRDPAVVRAGVDLFGGIFLFESGVLRGNGTVDATVVNFGRLDPADALGGPAALLLDGGYVQVGQDPELGPASGTFVVDVGGTNPGIDQDAVTVTGDVSLGGGLVVRLEPGFQPRPSDEFTIIEASNIAGTFDVALFPGLADPQRFLSVAYPPLGPGPSELTVVVQELGALFEGFEDPQSVALAGAPSAAALGDLDGADGPDLVVAVPAGGGAAGSVFVFLNAGVDDSGVWQGFARVAQVAVGIDPTAVAVGDLDGIDGPDLAVSSAGDDLVRILLNDGSGTSFAATDVLVGDEPRDVAIADTDGDLDLDLVAALGGEDSVRIVRNDGGAFVPLPLMDVGTNPVRVEPRDLDDDRDVDLVVANQADDTVSILFQSGGGAFGSALTVPAGALPVDLNVADLDRDDLPDVLIANRGNATVTVLLNEGGQAFAAPVDLPVGAEPRSVTTIDLEGDGDLDIALLADDGLGSRVVQVLRNDQIAPGAPLLFAAAASLAVGDEPQLVLAGDVDQDTDADLVTVNGAPSADGPAPAAVTARLNLEFAPCPEDLSGNGSVDFADLLVVIGAWGPCGEPCPEDLSGNGSVDFADLLLVLGSWGACP